MKRGSDLCNFLTIKHQNHSQSHPINMLVRTELANNAVIKERSCNKIEENVKRLNPKCIIILPKRIKFYTQSLTLNTKKTLKSHAINMLISIELTRIKIYA